MTIHLVLYSNNEPYNTTKQLTIDSLSNYTTKEFIVHDYSLEKIKRRDWFTLIHNLPSIEREGRRDGYYNIWKAFIIQDVYTGMKDGDILYYVDSSQYFRTGFTESIDTLCDIANDMGCIAGSVGDDLKNNMIRCCDKIIVWDKIIPTNNNSVYLDLLHVLNSWFLFKKCELNTAFIRDWVHFSLYTDADVDYPLATYHHTGDQSIFNILVIKYKLPVFYSKDIGHNDNKNKNAVLAVVNSTVNTHSFFIYL